MCIAETGSNRPSCAALLSRSYVRHTTSCLIPKLKPFPLTAETQCIAPALHVEPPQAAHPGVGLHGGARRLLPASTEADVKLTYRYVIRGIIPLPTLSECICERVNW